MKTELLNNARQLLSSFNIKYKNIDCALKQLDALEKKSYSGDITKSPEYQNMLLLLGPLATFYKVDQVLKLLKEMGTNVNNVGQSPYYKIPQYMQDRLY